MEAETQSIVDSLLIPDGFPSLPEGWQARSETFESADGGCTLFAYCFEKAAAQPPRRVGVVIHGYGEHGGRYIHLPHYLGSEFDAFYCIDLRGHGRSQGIRGHIERFDQYVEDSALFAKRIAKKFEGKETVLHLIGHSMGGLVAIRTLMAHSEIPFQSAVISAPLLSIAIQPPVWKEVLGRALSNVWGSLQMSTGLSGEFLSHDQAVQEAYMTDRLVQGNATPRWFTEVNQAMADTRNRTNGIVCPTLFLIPGDDHVVDAGVGLQFAQSIRLGQKRVIEYPEFYHEIMNEREPDRQRVFSDILTWIKEA